MTAHGWATLGLSLLTAAWGAFVVWLVIDELRKGREPDCSGEAKGDGYPGTRYFHDDPNCPGHR